MHHLLIQQAIIDEVWNQAFADGRKALKDTTFDGDRILKPEIEKWLAYLALQDYVTLSANDHTRNPLFITLKERGLEAKISNYFKEKYEDRIRENTRTYVQIASQAILGLIGLIAFVITIGKSCNGCTKLPLQSQIITTDSTKAEIKLDSIHQVSIKNSSNK
jgi:hypothetical protein